MSKTRRVEINRLVKHPKYKKYIRQRSVCYAHDEENESGTGDRVETQDVSVVRIDRLRAHRSDVLPGLDDPVVQCLYVIGLAGAARVGRAVARAVAVGRQQSVVLAEDQLRVAQSQSHE